MSMKKCDICLLETHEDNFFYCVCDDCVDKAQAERRVSGAIIADGKTLTVENSTITIMEEDYESLKHINVINGYLKVKMKNGSTVGYGGGHRVSGDVYRNNTSS